MADQTLEAFGQPNKGLSWGELIVDNILGLDNEYESFGEKLGKAINEDEIKFLKDAAVGVYEGTKEFVQAPVETTKQVVNEIKDSVTRLGSEDLNTRLQRMYNVTYEQATDEQVNQAREAVLGDALTALELVPAAKVTTTVAGAAIPSGLKADVVGQTKAMLSGDREFLSATPTSRATTQSLSAGFTGQNPPTYKKRNTPLSQQQDVELDEFRQPQPTEKTELSRKDFVIFRDPIKELAQTVTIPKKGLLGSEFLKMLKKNESIADSSLQPQIIDPKRRYTREELLEAIGDDEGYPGPNVFRSETYIGKRQGSFGNYQRQGQDAGFLGIGKELDYFELPVMSRPPSGIEGTGKPFKANSQHFDEDTIAHARGSIVQPADGVPVSFEYEDLIGQRPFLLVEEIQSDLLQKGYVKPGKLSDMAFKKVTEEWSRNNYVSFQEAFGEISKDVKNIFEELDEANIVRPDLVDGFGARDKFQRAAIDRGYVLSNELEEVLDKLNLTEEFIETSVMDLTDLARGRMNQYLPIVDVDTGAEFSIADFTERFKKEKHVTPREKTKKFFDKSRELLANKKIDKEINFDEFQYLYERYKTNQYRLKQGGYHQDVGLPPITKNKQAVEESLKALIAKAAREGVDKIVIPPADRIAKARERILDSSDKSDRFYRTYVSDLNKVLDDLEKNYPVEVRKKVEMPYDNRLSGPRKLDAIEQGLNTLSSRGELETFTVSSPSIEISIPEDMNYEILRQAMDREVHAENLTNEQEKVFKAFAKHNQVSLDEAPDVFSQWHVKQTDELLKKPWFQRMLPESDTAYGTILDISELVDEFKVESPRQFAEGGSIRPKLRPGSDRRISPKPQLRPDPERQYGLAEVEARADFDPAMHWNPIARLGFTGFSSDKTGKGNELYPPAFYFPSEMSKKRAIERAIANEIPYDKALTVEPDDIYIAPELANKRVWTHEMTHRGFDRIIESINNHPEGPSAGIKEFKDKYGDDTFRLLTARTSKSHEGIVEMFDDLEDSVLREAPEKEYLDDSSVDEIKRFQRTIKRKPEDRWQINQDRYRPYIKLMEAAQDMLTKAGEPPKSPDYEESILDKLRIKLGFAEGGTVDMNQQMSFAFEDGGLRDDGMMRDPVSGNEVPPGSTAKEVRDDIPAQLSEGEYVVPADVVRYYGVKFFEDLRDNAKMGLQDMEARGRIGGEPVPAGGPQDGDLSPEEMAAIQEMMGMAEGGVVNMYKQQQDLYSPPNPAIGNPTTGMAAGGEVRGYNSSSVVTNPMTDQSVLEAGQQAQQRGFVGFPLGATIFPSATTGQTVLGPSGTQVATTGNIGQATTGTTGTTATTDTSALTTVTLYGPNGEIITLTLPTDTDRYNQLLSEGWTTEMPVAGTKSDDGGGDTEVDTDPNAWMDKFDYTFGEGRNLNTLGTQTSELLTKIPFGGAIGLLGNGTKAAQAAANIIIMKANGQDTTDLEAELKKFKKETGLSMLPEELTNGDQLAKDIMLKHTNLARANATTLEGKPLFEDDQDFRDHMSAVLPETVSSPGLSGTTAESAAEVAKEQTVMSQPVKPVVKPSSNNDDDAPTHDEIMEKHYGTSWKDDRTSSQKEASDVGFGSDTGGWTPSGFNWNKGGLMETPKPKKKTRKYNKGGLAGKKK